MYLRILVKASARLKQA